jgi:predicted nucleic acid-binding protein
MLLDTTFLIDLEREVARKRSGRALAFLETLGEVSLFVSMVSYGELAEGCDEQYRPRLEADMRCWTLLAITEPIAWQYGRISRSLRAQGAPIGDNDIWIAATAIAHDLTLVTRNRGHFERVQGVRIATY